MNMPCNLGVLPLSHHDFPRQRAPASMIRRRELADGSRRGAAGDGVVKLEKPCTGEPQQIFVSCRFSRRMDWWFIAQQTEVSFAGRF